MNVMDGFVAIARKGEQRVVRVSRALRPNASELLVGPLCIDIRSPMQDVLISLEPGHADISFSPRFYGPGATVRRASYRFRKHGHLIHDLIRYTQVRSVSGCYSACNSGSDAILVQLRLFCAN